MDVRKDGDDWVKNVLLLRLRKTDKL